MRLLFIHGAGGYIEDRYLAEGLGAAIGCPVRMPHLPDEDMSFEAWAAPVRRSLAGLGATDILIAHSFGSSVLLRVLGERAYIPTSAVMLAMPDWGPDGWNVPEYAFDGPEPTLTFSLHHCRDDAIVPFDHLALHAARMPSAHVCEHPAGGHQFHGQIETIAAQALALR